jgi:hypothetical protein
MRGRRCPGLVIMCAYACACGCAYCVCVRECKGMQVGVVCVIVICALNEK